MFRDACEDVMGRSQKGMECCHTIATIYRAIMRIEAKLRQPMAQSPREYCSSRDFRLEKSPLKPVFRTGW